MKPTRRSLLKSFGLGAAGLFVPAKTFFLPPVGGWGIVGQGVMTLSPLDSEINGMVREMSVDIEIARFINEEVEKFDGFSECIRSEAVLNEDVFWRALDACDR